MVTNSNQKQQPRGPQSTRHPRPLGAINACVRDGAQVAERARISLYRAEGHSDCAALCAGQWSDDMDAYERVADNASLLEQGCFLFGGLQAGVYVVSLDHQAPERVRCVEVEGGCTAEVCFDLGVELDWTLEVVDKHCKPVPCARPTVGDTLQIGVTGNFQDGVHAFLPPAGFATVGDGFAAQAVMGQAGQHQLAGSLTIASTQSGVPPAVLAVASNTTVDPRPPTPVTGSLTVSHQRRVREPDGPMSFFVHLLDASSSLSFGYYSDFVDRVFDCADTEGAEGAAAETKQEVQCRTKYTGSSSKLYRLKRELTDHGVGAYELLRTATEAFLLSRCCVQPCPEGGGTWPLSYTSNADLGDYSSLSSAQWQAKFCALLGTSRLPYIQRVIDTAFPHYQVSQDQRFCADVLLRSRVDNPCFLELIWSYWHEEGMLVQCMNAIGRRFQNLHAPGRRDPLAHMEIDPLRPLNNILWGYVEDEGDRLSVRRRAYEYQHHYGLNLYGKAVSALRPADNRSEFIEAFHNLLNKCADYYRAKQDTTVDPDGYPILHAIQELNLILAQGAHNQFGDLPWTARVEMLMQQWILARPEIRDFLQSRAMVPHKEDWMPQVDTMKTLQRWTNVAVTHFRDLAVFGEQILLTIRWYNWYDVTSEDDAKGWADLLRAQIQSYIHAYRAVTGVDLSTKERVDYTMPSVHLRKRLALQQRVG